MSWLFSLALVEEYLEGISLDGVQSAQSSGKPTHQAYCAPDKMTAFSRLSRFGMTYKPLTEDRGKELLTLYRAGFPAKTSVPLGGGQELQEPDQECGHTWRGSLAKYDPNTHSWKTAQCSLFEDLEQSLETFPKSGMTVNGLLWELPMLEQTINVTESGLLPNGVDYFHTPNCTGLDGGSNSRKALKNRQENWPTPKCSDSRHSISRHITDPDGKWIGNLGEVVMSLEKFPTPMALDNRDRGNMESASVKRQLAIGKQVSLGQSVSPVSGRLNPTWVEWLMGWPLGWTDLKPLVTDKFPCAPPPPGKL